jgi:hypothetical protein
MALDFATRMKHLRCVSEFAGKVEAYPTKAVGPCLTQSHK